MLNMDVGHNIPPQKYEALDYVTCGHVFLAVINRTQCNNFKSLHREVNNG